MKDAGDVGWLNWRWSQALVDGLAAAGLRDLVLSPGSRSSPLALAFLRQREIRCHVIVDERSAGFVALGIASAGGRPAGLLCTSGSAVANWFPAVIEADLAAVPLLLLSADRPAELVGWGANQTIDQQGLFGSHVRAAHSPGVPMADFVPRYAYRLAARMIAESRWPLPGPVHLNLAFREPLLPVGDWPEPGAVFPRPAIVPLARPRLLPDARAIAHSAAAISGRPGVIVCGGADCPPGFADAVTALAAQLDCPLFAEPLSNLRFGSHDRSRLSVCYDAFLRQPFWSTSARPEWVLRFGAFPVTRTLQEWVAGAAPARQIVVTPDSRWSDPPHAAGTLIAADPTAACQALLACDLQPAPVGWRAVFVRAEARAAALIRRCRAQENFEGALIPALLHALPPGYRLFCGNSLAIRALDAFSGSSAKPLHLFGNRGASGIDGNLSTALGIATHGPCAALVGDLSTQHDLTALAAAAGREIVFIVVNNGGGGIFGYLPVAGLPEFERGWLTPQAVDLVAAARSFGVSAERCSSLAAFSAALERALQRGSASLLEVIVDRRVSQEQHGDFWRAIVAATGDPRSV
ncbi:2-succinyl-5-enolpyruvyl-6-hydroxy-3-cyclohexene-1-carboxylic-acid synthase [Accumulibacter sp.]|uniref:2-succinyl-5-enolpyruvyl-6-hydroxy-3- cyclohexene-1-carboxylic-acid synthase n=1 Tax=Accumulibacter sp. TaxID=2053492 RepID=UPI0026151460|nr:2-succinyl-5-enolpyruvyl-6-hydroxy-3-cyclohexene-1-carboxylic-acid synthase [Accumulibacter sp.]